MIKDQFYQIYQFLQKLPSVFSIVLWEWEYHVSNEDKDKDASKYETIEIVLV